MIYLWEGAPGFVGLGRPREVDLLDEVGQLSEGRAGLRIVLHVLMIDR